MNTIEIDDDVLKALKDSAEPFVDTPNTVLRRLLGLSHERESLPRKTQTGGHSSGRPQARQRTKKKASRAPTGSILPEQEYVPPLLKILIEKGGRAPAREIIEEVGRRLNDRLTTLDRELVSSGGVRWQNRVQFARLRLIDRGLIKRASPKGIWEITEAGADYIRSEEAKHDRVKAGQNVSHN